ncbi:hypothetical protein HDU67_009791 [Dinochytrium kinnereticum]|nr:hypothetical protein HDU67_009791 [Dinochytrium kinnereticum]
MAATAVNDRKLRIGDEIILHSENGGLLFADGPVKKRGYVTFDWKRRSPSHGDLMKCVFHVVPQFAFKDTRAFRLAADQDIDPDLFALNVFQRNTVPRSGIEELREQALAEVNANEADIIQLLNVNSKRYLSFNSKETVVNEPGSMPIEMEKYSRRECFFKILPKFRIRAEGEAVRIGDAIVLQSLKTEAHLNFTSSSRYLDPFVQDAYEATIGSPTHGWTVNLFRPSTLSSVSGTLMGSLSLGINANLNSVSSNSRKVLGGNFIRLYHKEKEGYIMSPSLLNLVSNHFENETLDSSQVQLNPYHFDPLNPQDISSSLILWQVEFAFPYDGGPVEWNQPLRLRHVVSNMYLQVESRVAGPGEDHDSYCVNLSSSAWHGRQEDDPSLFAFVPVTTDSGSITTGSYVRLQNIKTGTWLHATEILKSASRGREGSRSSFSTPIPIKVRDDKNIITERKDLKSIYYLKVSFIPRGGEDFASHNDHQALLRESSVIDAILAFLQAPFKLERRAVLRLSIGSFLKLEGYACTDDLSDSHDGNVKIGISSPISVESMDDKIVGIDVLDTLHKSISEKEAAVSIDEFKGGKEKTLVNIFQIAYRVLKQFLLGSNPMNQFHVAREFDTIAEHLDLNVGAADTLMQLMSGNLIIVQSIGNPQILHFVNLIVRDRKPSYIRFLIALCHCAGNAIPKHQEFIARSLLGDITPNDAEKDGLTHRFYTRVSSDGRSLDVLPPIENSAVRSWAPLKDLFSDDLTSGGERRMGLKGPVAALRNRKEKARVESPKGLSPSIKDDVYCLDETGQFFAAMLKLYEALCFGRNRRVIELMTDTWEVISLEKCKIGLLDDSLPSIIRASFCDLIRVAFVDIFPVSPVLQDHIYPLETISNPPTLKYVLKDAAIDNDCLDINNLSGIALWISNFLPSHGAQIAESKPLNELILSISKLLRFLVQYGIFADEDLVRKLFISLIGILDGRNDKRRQPPDIIRSLTLSELELSTDRDRDAWLYNERFEYNELNTPVIDAKIEICFIMELLLQLRLDVRVHMYLYYWFRHSKPDSMSSVRGLDIALGFPTLDNMFSALLHETAYFQMNDTLTPILLDLLRYDNARLKKSALRILHRLFSSLDELFQMLQICLMVNDSAHLRSYNYIKKQLIVFIQYGVGSPVASSSYEDVILGGIDVHVAEAMTLVLKDFAKLCVWGAKTSGETLDDTVIPVLLTENTPKADKVHQWILRNLSVFRLVLDLIRNRVKHSYAVVSRTSAIRDSSPRLSRARSKDSQRSLGSELDLEITDSLSHASPIGSIYLPKTCRVQSGLLLAAFEFLFYYANNNREHQAAIFLDLDLLLDVTHPTSGGCDNVTSDRCLKYLGDILIQSVKLCMQISDYQIHRILHLSGGTKPGYIRLLKCIVKPERNVIKRNQGLVIRCILDRRKLYVPIEPFLAGFQRELSGGDERVVFFDLKTDPNERERPSRLQVRNNTLLKQSLLKDDDSSFATLVEYMTELIDLFALCCEDKNGILQSMCQNILDIETVLKILNLKSTTLKLKRSLLRFLVSAYILTSEEEADSKSEYIRPNDDQIWNLLRSGHLVLKEYIRIVPSRTALSFDEIDDYVFQGLFVFATNLMKRFLNFSFMFDETYVNIANDFVDEMVKVAFLLRRGGDKENQRRRRILSCIDAFRSLGFTGQKFRDEEAATERLLDEIESLNTDVNSHSSMAGTPKAGDATKSIESRNVVLLNSVFQLGLKAIMHDPNVKVLKKNEFEELAIKFAINVDNTSINFDREQQNACTRSLIEYLEQTFKRRGLVTGVEKTKKRDIYLLSESGKDDVVSFDLTVTSTPDEVYNVKTLRLLEWIVRREIDGLQNLDRIEHPEEWTRLENRKVAVQEELNRLGCTLIAEKLATSDRTSVLSSSLRLIIVLLDGGNKTVQDTLEKYWLGTRQQISISDARKGSRFRHYRSFTLPSDNVPQKDLKNEPRFQTLQRHGSLANVNTTTGSNSTFSRLARSSVTEVEDLSSITSLSIGKDENDIGSRQASHDSEDSVAGSGGQSDGDFVVIRSVMRLLQLLVEGHNIRIQEYIRHQPDNIKTFDLVKDVVDYLHVIVPVASELVFPLIIQVFDTIIDFAQGCAHNQVTIFNAKIVRPVNIILAESQYRFSIEKAFDLKGHAMLSILSLLEDDSDEETKVIFQEMCHTLDLALMLSDLNIIHDKLAAARKSRKGVMRKMSVMAGFYLDSPVVDKTEESPQKKQCPEESNSLHEKLRECGYLDSPQDKIEDFISQSENIIYEIRNQARVAVSYESICDKYSRRKLESQVKAMDRRKLNNMPLKAEDNRSALSFSEPKEMHWQDYLTGFGELRSIYHIAMVLLAILGLRFPSVYSLHLLDFVYRDEVLQGVISSVTVNWSSLSKTVILGVIITYIYSVISFVYFRRSFEPDNGLYCGSLIECFITVLSYGLRAGGGVGDLLSVPVPQGESYTARIFLDLSFFLIVIVFLLNVIFGIIFDTFGQLREDRNAISTDLKNNCFICSIHAIHLQTKDPTEYTSHESHVAELLLKHDVSFMPVNRAMSLSRRDTDDMEDRIRRVEDRLACLNTSISALIAKPNNSGCSGRNPIVSHVSAEPFSKHNASLSTTGGLAAIAATVKLKQNLSRAIGRKEHGLLGQRSVSTAHIMTFGRNIIVRALVDASSHATAMGCKRPALPVWPARQRRWSSSSGSVLPILEFEPHSTLEHPLHGSTASWTPQPAIIVLQEWWGINEQIKDHAQRIANNTGAKTIVPDLYNGKSTADAEEASHMMSNLDWDMALKSLEALAKSLQVSDGKPCKVGATGFCMGGALSLALAGRMAKTKTPLNAVVSFYGIPPAKFDLSAIPANTPCQAHFGSEDTYVGFSDLSAAKELARKWDMSIKHLGGIHAHGLHTNESHVYIHHGMPHAFMNQLGKKLDEDHKKTIDATWARVFAFFIEHLKTV